MELIIQDIGFIIGTTLMYATPLIFTALGGVITERSGVVNIGLEGMMFFGAFVGAAVAYFSGSPWLGLLCAAFGGTFWGLIHAIACVSFRAEQIVSGIAINFLGAGSALFISRLVFDGATQTLTVVNKIPQPLAFLFGEGKMFSSSGFMGLVFNQFATVYLAFFMVALVWFVLYKTRLGMRVRAVGENPEAANTLGIDVIKIRYGAVMMSGFFAGMGGAAMSIAVVSRFSNTLISGHGFIALAAMIFGKWKPQGALLACLLFGAAKGFEIYLGAKGVPVAGDVLAMLPYVLTLVILVSFVGKTTAPAAIGKIYEKGDHI
ncbi:ABC transporter permease [Desulfopila aestuarii]|uniref:Simple sugar transport system permease protein n=1 Tax=Desulfopila aestuarii DSM 18488 TaxID=1121416 RepID=A0A1M7YIB1_9BACT|nr:ABC transporter permease [Desulfopila aestuarii]SHO52377.1 simple sugar transport system permease protein [Desulfopila aestuarii DSM 18488]